MRLSLVISVVVGLVCHVSGGVLPHLQVESQEQEVFQYLEAIETEILARRNAASEASWAYDSNLTDENLQVSNAVANENAAFFKQISETLAQYDYESFQDEDLKRRVKKLVGLGYSALPEDKFAEIRDAVNNMKENYAKIKVCDYHDRTKCDLALEPELTEIMANSRDAEELKYYWQQWYDAAGAPTREDFQKYVELNGEAARLNNYATGAESWLSAYEDETFEEQVDAVIEEMRPFYEQIHAYVRYKLREFYGEDVVSEKGPIPMHLLGNMWAQGWGNIADITSPFGDRQLLDVTEEMLRQGYNPIQMFEMGDEFFQSLNMSKVPQTFWEKSILEKPDDGRDLVCHASAWDFSKPDDVRIKQCTRVTMEQFFTVHHELGHIQYYLQYQHLPSVYRSGANPGFHEAVGDVLSLSVSTPKHLEKIGLLKDFVLDEESKLNQFYRSALTKLVFLPFAYTIDKYRWGIFRGEIKPEQYNCKFWEMRSKYSGIEPPVVRSEADLDGPAKYHVSADVEYLRYFVSYIIQFQFHRAACEAAGEYVKGDPVKTMNDCDIYQSYEAGNAIKAMLALGSSKPWPDAMEVLTGTRRMSADALIEYFQPLYDWLVVENERLGAYVGWEESDKCVDSASQEREVFQYLEDIETEILARRNAASEANWAYDSNLTDENLQVSNAVANENAAFFKQISETLAQYDYESFQDEDLKRRVKKLVGLGYSALPENKFNEIRDAVNNMKENYAKIKVCDYHDRTKCDLALEPELTEILANSRDAEELKYYWQQWYDAAGAPTREDFQKYVELNGEAARLNNYATGAESWLSAYDDETFEAQVDAVVEELRPFYEQIHAYVRYKLREFYGEDVVSEKGPIPMHLLGNMWAQGWGNIADITSPFGDRQLLDVTEEMLRQGYNPIQMFEMGDEFFQSLNMSKVPQTFWEKSILEKPDDGRDLVCHASAWDFSKPDDVRIKQCTRVTMEQFFTVHHELGHIQYYLQYQHLPSVYRSGANPGFHEAVGDVLSLSVSTPKHLEKIGLLKDFVLDEESKLNQFYRSALTKLVFLPFAYTIDKYRWGIFRGEIKPEQYNCKFWEMRSKYSGIEPPVVRSEADLDGPAKYHVSADVEYLRYFVSYIIQFQFHRAACEAAGEYVKGDPVKTLNDCDIYQSYEAGNAIKAMLALGSSKPWPDAMEVLTGTRRMSADALIEYFQPLYDWLVVENERLGAYVGWEESDKCVDVSVSEAELEARLYIERIDAELLEHRNVGVEAEWAYESDINDDNLLVKNEVAAQNAVFLKEVADTLNKYDYESFQDEDLKRKIRKLTKLGYSVLPENSFAELLDAINGMQGNYATVKVCDYHDRTKCDLALEPELTEIMATSRDPEELKYYWQQWYDAAGAPTRDNFQKYVDLNGEAARMNNYPSGAEYWLSEYEDETFEEQVDTVIEELRPLYEQIHANVRYQLRKYYGDEVVSEKGPIPMHLLGNMWAQDWAGVADITSPFPDRQLLDVTEEMVRQGYTPIQMFEMGDEFFQSLNMTKLPPSFWEKSILEKPDDGRDLVCHASAWEFSKPDDVRIKQCTRVTMDQFFTVHHEMGHVQYFLQYQHLPSMYRDGANPGFHEAVGDVLSLSVSTPKHLEKIGLLKDYVQDDESKLNQFYSAALNKLVFLPFAYTIDKYRWGIFRGEIKPEQYNCKFWEMRSKYSGIEPPVVRSEADLDGPAKYHVSADVEYLRYFVSFIIQFQFHRAACEAAGEYVKGDPVKTLNDCDIYQSYEAGNAIKAMLALGSSKPWPDAMEVLTGTRRMSADALIEYFQPLYDWLVVENERVGAYVGWEESTKCIPM